jgi:Holliday junction resolvase RusA-like endonuclease
MIKLKLPLPPSVNWLYAGKVRRYKSNEYTKWIELAKIEMMKQPTYTIHWDSWLEVEYIFHMPIYNKDTSIKKVDCFNYEKALSDFLEDNIVWFEDKKIKYWIVGKNHSNERYVSITIKELW